MSRFANSWRCTTNPILTPESFRRFFGFLELRSPALFTRRIHGKPHSSEES
jgi:hypothetical protein